MNRSSASPQVSAVAILLRQVYFTSPNVKGLYALGPAKASRTIRQSLRGLVNHLTQIGIPSGRVAIEMQFTSSSGLGTRAGLEPASSWLEVVKLEALAVKEVVKEFKVQGVWSWGWASFNANATPDPDKPAAACVWLWVRSSDLCDAPKYAGQFDTSLTEGQLLLPAGVRCTLGTSSILKSDVGRTAALTGDLQSAATALLQRAVLRLEQPIDPAAVLAAINKIKEMRLMFLIVSSPALSGSLKGSSAPKNPRNYNFILPAMPPATQFSAPGARPRLTRAAHVRPRPPRPSRPGSALPAPQ